MWELDRKEKWVPKNWCFWAVVLEKTLESPLDSKEIQAVHSKGNQSWIFIGSTDAEAPILRPPDVKNWLTGKDWCWERLKAGGKGDDRGWDSWMASLTWWTWVWVRSGSWWWMGKPRMLQSMGFVMTELTEVMQISCIWRGLECWDSYRQPSHVPGITKVTVCRVRTTSQAHQQGST